MVRRRNGDEGPNCHVLRAEVRYHVSCVEPAHAVSNDVDLAATGGIGDPPSELLGALLDASGRRDSCGDNMNAIGLEGLGDPTPVGDRRDPARREVKLGEA